MAQILTAQSVTRLGRGEIQAQLARCPSLPSLGSINKALQELLLTEQRYTAQIAEIIRRDPSLTSRLLRLVNSVYYGLTTPVNSISKKRCSTSAHTAITATGHGHARYRGFSTPHPPVQFSLAQACWQHCIGTAILTREVTSHVPGPTEDTDYVAGLVHDIGKIVMAWAFPDHFAEIHRQALAGTTALSEIEDRGFGHQPL